MLRRVQVSKVQEEVDVWKQLGQHGTGMYQVPHQRLPTQTGKFWHWKCQMCLLVMQIKEVQTDIQGVSRL